MTVLNELINDTLIKFKSHDWKDQIIRKVKGMIKPKKTGISVDVLSSINKEPIMIREGRHIGTAFHPEIHGDPLIHKYFLKIINGK